MAVCWSAVHAERPPNRRAAVGTGIGYGRARMLRAEGIVVAQGGRIIVEDVSLVLERGITTLSGPSGCGKSTLCRALARLVPLAAGRITLEPPPERWRPAVAYVAQHPPMFEGSLMDNLRAGPRFAGRELPDEECAALLARVGLVDAPRAAALSGGERLRLGLARALANHPRVLLLDEPTAALDPVAAERVLGIVAELAEVATLVVTHDEGHARVLGGTRLHMRGGRLA